MIHCIFTNPFPVAKSSPHATSLAQLLVGSSRHLSVLSGKVWRIYCTVLLYYIFSFSFQIVQYMFGSSFLAAPVVEKGVTEWEVYLPGEETDLWFDFSSYAQVNTANLSFLSH